MTPTSESEASSQVEHAERIAQLASIVGSHGPYRATCLRQSLAVWWLLRRRDIPAEIRIGVRKDGGEFLAHAWVELAGQALDDPTGMSRAYAACDTPAHAFSLVH
jgi:hypothetical protein